MRAILSVFASCLLFVFVASATETGAPGQQAIKEILAGAKWWTFIFEFTPENLPTDRASSTRVRVLLARFGICRSEHQVCGRIELRVQLEDP